MHLFRWLYFKFNEWRYGRDFGCGRCHHPHKAHDRGIAVGCHACSQCSCVEYSIERL